MNKIQVKLIAVALALTLSVSVVIMSSYAWMVLSSNPAATGIQVVIGGGNTILIAPNIETEDGHHIPGHFSDSINFGMYKDYDYLKEVGGLTPVSTSDGIDWFVAEGKHDPFLEHANLPKYITSEDENGNETKTENPLIREGNFIYLDFWVVAPAGDYNLRISTGTKDSNGGDSSGGSFVIDLPVPVLDTEGEVVTATLTEPEGSAAAAIRVGFLANPVMLTDDTMEHYMNSPYEDDRFTSLRGSYFEPNTGSYHSDLDNFVIYEPNADYHPGKSELEGTYVQTKPLVLGENGEGVPNGDIWNQLTVQLKSDWMVNAEYSRLYLEEHLNAALIKNEDWKDLPEKQIMAEFLQKSLQGQFSQYVTKGEFIKYSAAEQGSLRAYAESEENISAEQLSNLTKAGATEDVKIIELERNIPQRIRMFIWLEGQDMDCAASAKSASFAVNIEFAGGTE
ncbi:MAG: hypothetical protein IJA17_09820 [Oscillospiraceae bacterium]|nr:hypothetical protein [Oscillospiraceae bacterium]